MNKNLLFKLSMVGTIIIALVVWILSITNKELFGKLNFDLPSLLITIIAGGWGLIFLGAGIFSKSIGALKMTYIMIGTLISLVAILTIVNAFAIQDDLYIPIIAIVIVVGLFLALLFARGKKFDQGDNQKPGYKNYHERKAEEEASKKA